MILTERDTNRTVRMLNMAGTAEALTASATLQTVPVPYSVNTNDLQYLDSLIEQGARLHGHGNGFELYGRDYSDHLELMKKVS